MNHRTDLLIQQDRIQATIFFPERMNQTIHLNFKKKVFFSIACN